MLLFLVNQTPSTPSKFTTIIFILSYSYVTMQYDCVNVCEEIDFPDV
jgi:hypothetical protein